LCVGKYFAVQLFWFQSQSFVFFKRAATSKERRLGSALFLINTKNTIKNIKNKKYKKYKHKYKHKHK